MLTEEGVKKLAKVDYTSKFKDINWTCDINTELPLRVCADKANVRAPGSEGAVTVSQAFLAKVERHQGEECMKKLQLGPDGYAEVTLYTWREFYDRAMQVAKALHVLGVPERSTVCLMGHNSPEHFMSVLGAVLANCVFTEVYLTNGPAACAKQVLHSQAQVIICDTYKRYSEKFAPVKGQFPWVKAVILCSELKPIKKKDTSF